MTVGNGLCESKLSAIYEAVYTRNGEEKGSSRCIHMRQSMDAGMVYYAHMLASNVKIEWILKLLPRMATTILH